MMLKAKPVIVGFAWLVASALIVYYIVYWFVGKLTPDDWRILESSPVGFTILLLLMLSSSTAYVSARVAKEKEFLYGVFWFVFLLLSFLISDLFNPPLSSVRFPIPSLQMGWWWLLLVGMYLLMTIGASLVAEDVNKKKKIDSSGTIGVTVVEAADNIWDWFKHH